MILFLVCDLLKFVDLTIMSQTTLLNVDNDTSSILTDFISRLIGGNEGATFAAECKNLESEALVSKYLEHADLLFTLENEKDVEGCVQAIMFIVLSLGDSFDATIIVRSITDSITSKTDNKVKSRMRALVSLFNLISSYKSKFEIMTAIFKFAIATNQTAQIAGFHSQMEQWAAQWGLSIDDKRTLYKLVADLLSADGKAPLALYYLVLLLKTFAVSGEKLPEDVVALTVPAVVNAIKSPLSLFKERNSLLESIPAEASSPELSALTKLLRIVCSGSLQEFDKFVAEAGIAATMAARDLDAASLRRSLQLLTLCSLAAASLSEGGKGTVRYSEIAATLGVPVEDVELWVVEAVSNELLEATIDQIASVINVRRCTHRSFGTEQWRGLQAGLRDTRAGLKAALETIKASAKAVATH